ncbi:hypothetical protein VaNZ11_012648, partial [Volvox africanus]
VEEHAAKAHDVMAIRCRGTDTVLNYVTETYMEIMPVILPYNGRRPLHRNEVVRLLRSHGKEATRQTHAAGRYPGRSVVTEAAPEPPVTIFGDDECDLYGVMPGSTKPGSAGGGGSGVTDGQPVSPGSTAAAAYDSGSWPQPDPLVGGGDGGGNGFWSASGNG